MSLQDFVKQTQLWLEQILYESKRALRAEPASSVIEALALEERILMSASPAAVIVVDPAQAAEVVEPLSPAGTEDSALQSPSGPTEGQFLELAADSMWAVETEDATTEQASEQSLELAFIDASVSDIEQMIAGLQSDNDLDSNRTLKIVILDSQQDGIAQITSALLEYDGIDGIHIVSHGDVGQVQLGSTTLSLDNLDSYRSAIGAWQHSLSAEADLLFYGCNLAATDSGRELMNQIGAACNCDVAASDDVTGHADVGADWDLEYAVGTIETSTAFSASFEDSWISILGNFTVTNTNNSGTGSLRQAILDANTAGGTDTIDFNISTGDSNYVDPTPGAPGSGDEYWTIQLTAVLPAITEAVVIDATTQSGFGGTPVIELDGTNATGSDENGFTIETSGVTIRGFAINRFADDAIEIDNHGGGHKIVGNYLGTDITGLQTGYGRVQFRFACRQNGCYAVI
ncbi:MAG: DUF4347 domain-containing protein [Planctomycetaceae bacterium]